MLAQSTNSTADKSQYLYKMGNQLGLATKLYQLRGKSAPVASRELDLQTTALIGGSVLVLMIVIGLCFVKKHKKNAKQSTEADSDEVAERTLTVNEN